MEVVVEEVKQAKEAVVEESRIVGSEIGRRVEEDRFEMGRKRGREGRRVVVVGREELDRKGCGGSIDATRKRSAHRSSAKKGIGVREKKWDLPVRKPILVLFPSEES